MRMMIKVIKKVGKEYWKFLSLFVVSVGFALGICVLFYFIYSIQLLLFEVHHLYIIGYVLLALVIFLIFYVISLIHILFLYIPLFPNIVFFLLFRFLNLFQADLSAYFWCEVYLSLIVLFCALEYMINWRILCKFKWIRTECRLLHAVCDDISQALQARDHADDTDTDSKILERARLQLTDEEERWVKKTDDVISKAEPVIKAFPAHAQHWLSRRLLFLQLYKLLSIAKNISRQRDKSAFVKSIYQRLENSRTELWIPEGKLTEDEIESASPKHLVGRVTSLLQKLTNHIPGSQRRNLNFMLMLLEAFLKDLEDVKVESAIGKAWFEDMKVFLDDIDNAFHNFINRNRRIGFHHLLHRNSIPAEAMFEIDEQWMTDGWAGIFKAKKMYGFKFIRMQQQIHPYEEDVLDSDQSFGDLSNINSHPAFQTIRSTEEGLQITYLCNILQQTHMNLKSIEGQSNFRLVCWEEMKKIASELRKAFKDYIEKRDTLFQAKQADSIGSRVHALYGSIEAYDTKVWQKSRPAIGLEKDTDALVSKLTIGSEQCSVFSIVGMQGIGKTTLAKMVYHHKEISRHFPHRIWVSVPKDFFDVNTLLENVANQIISTSESQEQEKGNGKEHCIHKIQNFLHEKKYLVVLDNVLATTVWDMLKNAFPERRNESRILLTTHYMTVASHASESNEPHQLRLRTKEESWVLFMEKVQFPPEVLTQNEMLRKAREVVGSCWGLPLSLSHLSVLMAGETLDSEKMSRAFEQVDQFQTLWSETMQINDLPNCLRSLLSFFTLFPKNFEIPARRLIVLWVAEELVRESPGEKNTLENIADSYLLQLIGLNIIQPLKMNVDGKAKTCCLPHPLHDVVLSTGSNSHQQRLADHNDRNDASFELIHGAGSATNLPNVWQNHENLVSFISFDTREGDKPGNDMGNFLRRGVANGCFKKLKVLDLERVFRPQLPKTIGKLIELRYLGLRWSYLEEIPSTIGYLTNLQTLDLKHTYIRTLPNTIWKLQKLRHLYLNQAYRSKFVHQSETRSFRNLQTLWGVFLDENSPLTDRLDELKSLTKLELAFQLSSTHQGELAKKIANLEHLQSLRLKSISVMSEPQGLYLGTFSGLKSLSNMYLFGRLESELLLSKFPECLSNLTLSASGLQYDPMQVLEKLPHLRSLCLFSDSFTGKSMVCSKGGFAQLLVLKLWKLGGLAEWTIEKNAMQNLKELELKSCPLLQVPDGLRHVKSLRKLKLENMPEAFVEYRRRRWYNRSYLPSIINY